MVRRLLLALRTVMLRRRLDREMQEEMDLHLARSAERLTARGLSADDARRAARREFGNVDLLQEQGRDARGLRWVESLVADVRFGLRHFARTPFSTLTMIMLLALGIGVNSALFTVMYSVVNMPMPGIERDDALVRIRGIDRNQGLRRNVGREFSYLEYREYAARGELFSAVTAWTSSDVVLAAADNSDNLQSGAATYVSANYFAVLGVRPILGAGFPAGSNDHGGPQLTAVISHAVWDRMFGRAPDVVGRSIRVNDALATVVAVAPPRFAGTRTGGSKVRVWLPLNARPLVQRTSASILSSYDSAFFGLAARLRPGVEPTQASALIEGIAARAAQQSGPAAGGHSADVVIMLAGNYFPPSGVPSEDSGASLLRRLPALLSQFLLLMIPCTNVSALLVGLAAARRREIAVRLSLGAARKRIVRQLMTESVLLALAGASLGLFIIWLLLQTIGARIPDLQLALHWPAFAFTFGVAIFTGIVFGVSPSLHATRLGVAEVLKNASNAVASTRSRLQAGLVVTQIAVTMPLLLGLGTLMLELLADVQRLPAPGSTDRIAQVTFDVNQRYGTREADRDRILPLLQQHIAALPGVVGVVPQGRDGSVEVTVHPFDRISGVAYRERFQLRTRGAPPGFFRLMGFPFTRGRDFEKSDGENVVVIRGDLARELWGSADPIGRRFVHAGRGGSGTAYVVVGVVDEKRAGMSGSDDQHVFVPALEGVNSLLVRTAGPAQAMLPALRALANSEAPSLPITRSSTLAALDAGQRSLFKRVVTGTSIAGAVALFLCAIGLYAIVAFAVSQRTREIGIRTALGADPRAVARMFFLRGIRLSVLGLAIGLGLSTIVVRLVTLARNNEMSGAVLLIAGLVGGLVVAIASVATWIPARRAATVDPLSMLRTE